MASLRDEGWYSTVEAAVYLRTSVTYVNKLVERGCLEHKVVCRRRFFRLAELARYAHHHTRLGTRAKAS
jgi:excisionase family DNA binding protein